MHAPGFKYGLRIGPRSETSTNPHRWPRHEFAPMRTLPWCVSNHPLEKAATTKTIFKTLLYGVRSIMGSALRVNTQLACEVPLQGNPPGERRVQPRPPISET